MIQYEMHKTTTSYPFKGGIPFPGGLIKQLRVALKNTTQTPFVSSIASAPNYFSLQLQTKSSYIGNFLFQGDKWITLNNDNAFGFVQLEVVPIDTYSYFGKWQLQRVCYTFPVVLTGIKTFTASGLSVQKGPVVNISVAGDLSVRTTGNSSVINIGRDSAPHKEYTESILGFDTYIKTVNGIAAKQLALVSSDSTIIVERPVHKRGDLYIMYIKTTGDFPVCPEWVQSDSGM